MNSSRSAIGYQNAKARARDRSKAMVLAGQDIGAVPLVKEPLRGARADDDFRFFCESYFPHLCTLAWCEDHLKVIAKIAGPHPREPVFRGHAPRRREVDDTPCSGAFDGPMRGAGFRYDGAVFVAGRCAGFRDKRWGLR